MSCQYTGFKTIHVLSPVLLNHIRAAAVPGAAQVRVLATGWLRTVLVQACTDQAVQACPTPVSYTSPPQSVTVSVPSGLDQSLPHLHELARILDGACQAVPPTRLLQRHHLHRLLRPSLPPLVCQPVRRLHALLLQLLALLLQQRVAVA
jgi:hypothetical protein